MVIRKSFIKMVRDGFRNFKLNDLEKNIVNLNHILSFLISLCHITHQYPSINVDPHIEIPFLKNRHQWTLSANSKKIPSSVYLFHQNIQVFLSTVTIVLPKGDLREADHLGNGVEGGSTLCGES